MAWTLKYTAPGGEPVSKAISDWGITAFTRLDRSQSVGTLKFSLPGNALLDLPFAYKGKIELFRTIGDAADLIPFYTGIVTSIRPVASGTSHRIDYTVSDPWWFFTQVIYQQTYKVFVGWQDNDITTGIAVLEDSPPTTHVVLNHDEFDAVCGTRVTLGQILDWAISQGAPFQYVSADLPDMPMPPRAEKDIFCEYAIRQQLALMDAYTWFDHSTTPPTFHCQRRGNLTPATIDCQPAALSTLRQVEVTDLIPRYDLQVPYVRIIFEKEVNGRLTQPYVDFYPNPLPADSVGALISTVTLLPFSSTILKQQLTVEAIDVTSLDWWKSLRKEFADSEQYGNIALVPGTGFIKDLATGEASTLPNKIVSGAVATWMAKTVRTVEVGVQISYQRRLKTVGENYVSLSKPKTQLIKARLKATNATSGEYSQTIVQSAGEDPSVFAGMAQSIYQDFAVLNFEGQVQTVEAEFSGTVGMGNALNLTNGRAEWAAMNAGIQSVSMEITETGGVITTFELGPNKHLTPGQIVDILRWNRTSQLYAYIISRNTSVGMGSTDLPEHYTQENSTDAHPSFEEQVVNSTPEADGKTWLIRQSATAGTGGLPAITVQKVDATGGAIANTQKLNLDLGVLPADKEVKLQACQLSVGGVMKTVYVPASDAFSGGGSGSGAIEVTLVAVWHDVYECQSGGNTIYVAKSRKLRNSIASEVLRGTNYAYIYDASYDTRTSNGTETQVVIPPFIIGDVLLVTAIPETVLIRIPGDNPVLVTCGYIDLNIDGRAWARDPAS